MHILVETLQRAQHQGVILHRRETRHGADKEGALRNTPTAAPGGARTPSFFAGLKDIHTYSFAGGTLAIDFLKALQRIFRSFVVVAQPLALTLINLRIELVRGHCDDGAARLGVCRQPTGRSIEGSRVPSSASVLLKTLLSRLDSAKIGIGSCSARG